MRRMSGGYLPNLMEKGQTLTWSLSLLFMVAAAASLSAWEIN